MNESGGRRGCRRPLLSPCSRPAGTPEEGGGQVCRPDSSARNPSYLATEVSPFLTPEEVVIDSVGCYGNRPQGGWVAMAACCKQRQYSHRDGSRGGCRVWERGTSQRGEEAYPTVQL